MIAAVCGSTAESSSLAAAELTSAVGYRVEACATAEQMVAECALDAVAVCSPAECHEAHLALAAGAGLHAFCEKPLIWTADPSLVGRVAAVTRAFQDRGLVLQQNTQWTFLLDDLEELVGERSIRDLRSFEMFLAPAAPGLSMFWEAVPHPVSVLAALGASGPVSAVRAQFTDHLSGLEITFHAHRCAADPVDVRIVLRSKAAQPRPCYIALDEIRVDREVLSLSPYRLALRMNARLRPIQDPLHRSVRYFVNRLNGRGHEEHGEIMSEFRIIAALWPAVLQAGQVCAVHAH